jgi:hypothetical protein
MAQSLSKQEAELARQEALDRLREQQLAKEDERYGQEMAMKDRQFALQERNLEGDEMARGLLRKDGMLVRDPNYVKPQDPTVEILRQLQVQNAQQTLQDKKKQAEKEAEGTDAQKQAATFAKRMSEADTQYGEAQGKGYAPSIFTGSRLYPEMLKGSEQKTAENSKRNFIAAVLRKESGAAISPSEFQEAEKLYFPQVGDSPENIQQKAQARADALAGMQVLSGPAEVLIKQRQLQSQPQQEIQVQSPPVLDEAKLKRLEELRKKAGK